MVLVTLESAVYKAFSRFINEKSSAGLVIGVLFGARLCGWVEGPGCYS